METTDDRYRVYAEFGIASEKAQVLEVEAGNVVLLFMAIGVDPNSITDEERASFHILLDDVNRKTLGNLLKRIKSLVSFEDSLIETIDSALERRNYLAHKFFRNHNFAIFSPDGKRAMVEDLRDASAKIDAGWHCLSAISTLLSGMAVMIPDADAPRLLDGSKKVGI